jgi:ADP-heptose:LPS heptosyltransferase
MRSLVVAGQGVGNIIMATPLVRALKAMGHNVHFYFKANFSDWDKAFNHPDFVDKINGDLEPEYDYIFNTWWADPNWTSDVKGAVHSKSTSTHELLSNLYLARMAGADDELIQACKKPFVYTKTGSDGPYFDSSDLIGLHAGCNPGPLWEGKKWKNYQALATKLRLQGRETVGFGSVHDQHLYNTYWDLWDLTAPEALVIAISQCSLFISNDTGPMHIAAALDIPQIAIVGGEGYKRWHKNDISIYAKKAIILGDENINKITVDKVLGFIK